MKNRIIIFFGIFCISLSTKLAHAQSFQNGWSGRYVQLGVGYGAFLGQGQSGTTYVPPPINRSFANSSNANDIETIIANVSAGYNFELSNQLIIGVGATYLPAASKSASLSFTTSAPGSVPTTGKYNIKNAYNLFVAPGYAINKNQLAYAKIGFASSTVSAYAPTGVNAFPTQNVKISGLSLGLGYKHMISKSVYLLGEFNYANFNPTNVSVVTNSGTTVSTSISGKAMDYILGIGYRF